MVPQFFCFSWWLFLLPGNKVELCLCLSTGIAPLAEDCLVVELSRSLGPVHGFYILAGALVTAFPFSCASLILASSSFPSRSSSTTTTSPIRSAAFPSASTLRSSLSAADGYAAPLDPAILQKEASRVRESKTERAQTDNNVYTSKLPSGANLEQSPSPIKAMESRPLPASGPASSHHYGRGQGKSQQHHHPLDQQHAASGSEQHSREKSQSKRFSMQEQELRALGKTTTTAANFTDVIIMHQMSCDKGQRERGSLSNDSTSEGQKLEGRGERAVA